VQRESPGVPGDGAPRPAEDAEGIRLPLQPVLDQFCLLGAVVPTGHRDDRLPIRRLDVVDPVDAHVEALEVPRHRRMGAREEHQVRDTPQPVGFPGPFRHGDDLGPDPAVQPGIAVAVAPAQIGVEQVTHEVVRVQPMRPLLDEGQPAQPSEQLTCRVPGVEDSAQQILGGEPRICRRLERGPVLRARRSVDDVSKQRPDQIGCVEQ
jgi:hypothetical protein